MLSDTAEYALRAVLYIADHGSGEPLRVERIAAALGVPRNYLSKTLHQLAKQGVLVSTRGPGGGFRLARDPSEITLERVVEGFDPGTGKRRCLLGRPTCGDDNPCPAHVHWKGISEQVQAFFREMTVAQVLERPAAAADAVPMLAAMAER